MFIAQKNITPRKIFAQQEPQRLFLVAIPCSIKLKIWEIVVIIRIFKAFGQIFSLIVQGMADRNKRCGSYWENLFLRVRRNN